ncbi:signal transduction histidine kinase [Diaminobutyricimonas aerilata]|uniref:histidine kinase n=1 Tax=Diaminobutyricimonas aerilata TaxID=1162967 RepID=A0A2M9CG97_9MICO|nr:signal transduction histidine kinase [Diaminobutyricimonas aerilata]
MALIAILVAALLLLVRRRWPIPVLAGCVALYGLASATGTVAPGIVLAIAIATFGLANRSTRRVTIIAAAITAAAVFLLSVIGAVVSAADPRMVQFVLAVALAAAAGDATRSRREYIVAITERAERAEQTREAEARRRVSEERLRIARDLHDTVAHQIAVISLNAGLASSSLESPEKAKEALSAIRSASRAVLSEIGNLLALLRTEDPDAVITAPPPGLGRLDELVAQFAQSGLAVRLRVEGDPGRVGGTTDLVAYHVIQEGLTNALKHGGDHRAHVLVEVTDDQVAVVVTNPTVPSAVDAETRGATVGHGLLGLRERVASVRGVIESGITAGGYRLAAVLPSTKEGPG